MGPRPAGAARQRARRPAEPHGPRAAARWWLEPFLGLRLICWISAAVAVLYLCGAFQWLDNHAMDLRFRMTRRPAGDRPTVVAIDSRSLATLDVWPWPRGYHATVLENLLAAGARQVAFDLDFSSRSSPEEDEQLRAALEQARNRVVLSIFRQWEPASDGSGRRLVLTSPLPMFARPARLATINIEPESGGLLRRYKVLPAPSEGSHLSLAAMLSERGQAAPESFHLDFGLDAASLPQISYVDVLTGSFEHSLIAGKSVIVGATAIELGDRVTVPVHATLPGPVLQALATASLDSGRALHPVPAAPVALISMLVAWGAGAIMLRSSWRWGLLIMAGGASLWCALTLALQRATPWFADVSPVVVGLTACYGVSLVRRIDHQHFNLVAQKAAAQRTEMQMRHVVENCAEAIITLDDAGLVTSFNRAAEELFGVPSSGTIGSEIRTLLGQEIESALRRADAQGASSRFPSREITVRRADGERLHLELTPSRFQHDGRSVQVLFLHDVTQRRMQEEALEHQATHDALTNLPNRILLKERLEQALQAARQTQSPLALMILDLDRFKEVNDTLGHNTGDLLLVQIAERLRQELGPGDTIARLGGDEFSLLLPGAGLGEAEAMAGRLLGALHEPFELLGVSLQVDASVGAAIFPDHGQEMSALLKCADVAMYVAKLRRNTFAVYTPEADINSVRHLKLRGEMRQALEGGLFHLHYQPKIRLETGRPVGVEALLRWKHPQHGMVSPMEFIPLAERTGLIRQITAWVLETAVRQCAIWERQGLGLSVSVNCSARNLLEEDLPRLLRGTLERSGLPPERLILEITETAIIEDPQRALDVIKSLNEMGVRISIDDFGTGYSSMEYLRKLPASELKIDKAFVLGVDRDEGNAAIVRATVNLAHNFGLEAVAEGIESEAVLLHLRSVGCDLGQGYYIAPPLTVDDLARWMARQTRSVMVELPGGISKP